MTFKQLYKSLHRELLRANAKAWMARSKKQVERTQARLQYEKIQLVKQGKSTRAIDEQLATVAGDAKPAVDSTKLKQIVTELEPTKVGLANLYNIGVFLRSQRIYSELIERYNPGLGMEQQENVRKSANRVGLTVPEK